MEVVYKVDDLIVGRANCIIDENNIVIINSVVVDSDYRNQGIANKLMLDVVRLLIKNNYKCLPLCSYAIKWFDINSDYKYLLNNFQ